MGFFDWVTSERYQEMEAARDRALSRNAELLEHGRLLEAENAALREELSYMKLSRDKWEEMAERMTKRLDEVRQELQRYKDREHTFDPSKLSPEAMAAIEAAGAEPGKIIRPLTPEQIATLDADDRFKLHPQLIADFEAARRGLTP